ncbi:hypothetical protein [Corynebacterium tuberculostearicum]|uniref:hypothetical protein n=1 Tax=Corynebacterium tuberculostearicum TaxID=38304 RepID=UPI002646FD07|nr:hypothetical protein [Corynebacterium tuberculostearicum]MDV2432570.1 hypothetical protein [Corynebacterium tuberculostearicum]WKE60027.1 hypothetical protein KAH61_02515 [Corynebacterium tuberculostearicum]
MSKKFEESTGGMKLSIFALAAAVILTIYLVTANTNEWLQSVAVFAVAGLAIWVIRSTGAGRRKDS